MFLKVAKICRPVFVRSMPKLQQQHSSSPPSCKNCKWSVDNGKLCILFNISYNNSYAFSTEYIRKNIDLCGPEGIYFKQSKNKIK